MNNKTAELLVTLRKNRGFTQTELADKLGVSFQAISKWERGENLPDAQLLVELAKLYGITVDEILKGNMIKRSDSQKIMKRKQVLFVVAILLLALSPVSVGVFGVDNYQVYVPVILGIAVVAIPMILYASMGKITFQEQVETDPKQKRYEEIIYTSCAAIFLLIGLIWGLWNIAWIVFLFGYIATLIVKKP